MIQIANCKINIGLNIVEKREDGYHNLVSLFVPVPSLYDIVEVVKAPDGVLFSESGITIGGDVEDNLCCKAYEAFKRHFSIDGAAIHLHKNIPFGAGLGGGSSDAASVIKALNSIYEIGADDDKLAQIALEVGSDVPFFVYNTPMIATGRGEILTHYPINLSGKAITIVKADFSVSTKEAYAKISPKNPENRLDYILKGAIDSWRGSVINDFEAVIHPDKVNDIKDKLYSLGATYSAMSGSGSAIFALSDTPLTGLDEVFKDYFIHQSVL